MVDHAEIVTIVWPSVGGRSGVIQIPWVKDRMLKHYLLHPQLRQHGVGALTKKCRIYNSDKIRVKTIYKPTAGDTVVFVIAPRR